MLSKQHKIFADEFIKTKDKVQSYLKAYPKAKPTSAAVSAIDLLKKANILSYINDLERQIKTRESNALVLTVEMKREILYQIATGQAEYEMDVLTKRGEKKTIIRKPTYQDRIKAAELDSKLCGDMKLPSNSGELEEKLIKIEGEKIIVIQNFNGLI